ncbi:MAG: hypothetical protein WBF81_08635 [Thermoplasmata archaeon]
MTPTAELIALSRCETCKSRFLPVDGPCPRCGSTDVRPYSVPALGTVLAATELTTPSEGWPAPHRLALVELPESVRLLAIVDGPLPSIGDVVGIHPEAGVYHAGAEPAP